MTRRITAAVTALLLGLVGVVVGGSSAFASEGAGITLSGNFMGGYIIEAGPNAGRQVFCIDAGRAEPGPGIDYAASALGGSQQAAYLLGHYGNTTDGTTGAALSYIIARDAGLPHDNATAPGFDNPGTAVLDRVAQLQAEAAAYAGPYTLTPTNVTNPTAASGTVVKRFRLTSAAGNPMQGVTITLAGTGSAIGLTPGSASTNANGEVTVTYQLANSATGGVGATASGLYSNVTVYTPVNGGNYQRLVGTGAPGSVQASATATRPAEPTGRVRIFKQSTGGGAGLGGATFEVRQGSTVVATGTTAGANGWTPWLTVNTGSYTIVETAAPTGFNLDAPNQSLTVTAGGDHEVTMQDSPQGRVSVIKTDAATGNRLAGATFEVVRGGTVLATGTTNSNGEWTSDYLGGGTKVGDQVTIRETAAPAGYQTVGQQTVTVTRDGSGTARWTVADPRVFGNAAVAKVDSVTGAPLPGVTFTAEVLAVGASTWTTVTGGAQSGTTEPSPGEYVTNPAGRVIIDGTLSSPQFHYGDQIRFTETATAAGYVLPVEPLVVTGTIGVDGTLVVNGANSPERTVQVAKTTEDGGPMEGVSFTVCYSSGGRPLLRGEADARTACEVPAGTGIGGVDDLTGWYLIDNSLVTGADGRTAITDPSPWIQPGDQVAAFETMTPHGYQWQPDAWLFDVTAAGYTAGGTAQESTLVSAAVVNQLIRIGTTAFTDQGKTVPVGGGTVTDSIAYEGLIPGESYTAKGIINQIVDGDVIATPITAETTFVSENTDGTVDVVFQVPAELVGSVLVVFEEVYRDSNPDTPVAEHENPEDTDQIVYFPSVGTSALNADDTLGKIVAPGATVIDTVTVCAAQPGAYLLTGTAIALGPDGEPYEVQVAGSARITVTSTDCADYPVEFLLGDDIVPGTALVFAETLYQVPVGAAEDWAPEDGDLPEGVHDDPTDEAQTVYYPVIGTNAADSTTLSQNISTGSLTDTVSYTNLQPGVEYTVTGTLMVVEGELPAGFDTGQPEDDADDAGEASEPGADDELVPTPTGITVSTTFTPISPSGSVDVVFDVPAELAGLVLVVYEQVALSTLPDVPVASHEDPTDTDQYGWVPEIGTTAGNAIEDLGKTVNPGGTLIDTIAFEGLQPGKEYRLTGEFQVVIDGKITATGITGEATLTPETASGSVDVEFAVPDADALADLDLVGRDIVAFEQLWEGDVLIAIHADIDDEGQTTEVPSIGTEAGNGDDDYGKIVTPDGTLIDTISYTNLRPGVEYTAVGEFQIIVDGKATPSGIDGTATFTPTTPDGEVVVEFKVPAEVFEMVAGSTLVAFETVSQGDVLVAIHADVTDEAQTVHAPEIGTTATDKADGDKTVEHDGVVVDTIAYCGLEPGESYTALGELQQVDADGTVTATGITGTTTFTADVTCGEAVVEFQLDGTVEGKTVVFERLVLASDEDLVVATHEDPTDEGQTVEIAPEGSVTGGVVNGGGGIPSGEGAAGGPNAPLVWTGIGLVVAAGLALVLLSAHRRREAAQTLIPQGI